MTCSRTRQTDQFTSSVTPTEYVGAGGLILRASRFGELTAPIVLLLHGGGQTRYAWNHTAQALSEMGYCAITLDARGHGESDWCAQGDYSTESLVADLGAVICALPTAPVIVGASMGGLTAMLALGEDDSLPCSALVLVDVAPRLEQQGVRRIIEFMCRHHDGFDDIQQVRDAVAAYNPHRAHANDLSGLHKNLRRHNDGRLYWHWDPAFLDHARLPSETDDGMFERIRLESAARKLSMPVLLIRGHQSDVLSDQGARELLDLVPHAHYEVLDQAGHMVAGDRNTIFTEAVLNFLHNPSCIGDAWGAGPLTETE
ncbi:MULTISPECIES: alpha/beta fold hydrolase [Ketobacter]|uniref:Alpha/beta hydrolase n=1 Tax=Ketobacter alkanivorans TaxID=1917421 RepID=A0A2K9LFC8_9GAMM|nr:MULTISPECIES: alpha/beta hydrolase [Ketobacter]AUM11059.1 alpha/beta hydrolase [Ketobacter alkanivorans]MVF14867.1 alpha/beta hydrolase [Ketobacter sp. MCCC 1A13808]